MSPVTIALAGLVALLVLLPTRRLQLAGWSRDALVAYFLIVWALGAFVAVLPAPARFLIPILLIAYLAPFVTLRDGLDRLFGRPPRSGDIGRGRDASDGSSRGPGRGPAGTSASSPGVKNVTPPDAEGR